jgi:hypothetical protein
VTEPYCIPSREEHNRLVRRVWKISIILALVLFGAMGGTAATLLVLGHTFMTTAYTMLVIIYVVVPLYAIGYMAPALATSLIKMSAGVEMSREGLEIGRETLRSMDDLKSSVEPLIKDARVVISDVKPVVNEIGKAVHEGKSLFDEVLKEIKNGNGKLEGRVAAILRKAVTEAKEAVRGAEGDFERLIWTKVDKFLESVFTAPGGAPEGAPPEERDQLEVRP